MTVTVSTAPSAAGPRGAHRAALPGPGGPAAVPHRGHPDPVPAAIGDLTPTAQSPRHRPHRAGSPERLPPGPLLLRCHRLGHGPLAAAEKPAPDRAGPQSPYQRSEEHTSELQSPM